MILDSHLQVIKYLRMKLNIQLSVEFLIPPVNPFHYIYYYPFSLKLTETDQLLQHCFLNLSHVRFPTTVKWMLF